ncbi:hypothetical protein GCM10010297_20350 [Streptomyces malachitofuscus]|nr:hypothetical protein GCM10010297_20350 [Streptomyces malachitofuscus]
MTVRMVPGPGTDGAAPAAATVRSGPGPGMTPEVIDPILPRTAGSDTSTGTPQAGTRP